MTGHLGCNPQNSVQSGRIFSSFLAPLILVSLPASFALNLSKIGRKFASVGRFEVDLSQNQVFRQTFEKDSSTSKRHMKANLFGKIVRIVLKTGGNFSDL